MRTRKWIALMVSAGRASDPDKVMLKRTLEQAIHG